MQTYKIFSGFIFCIAFFISTQLEAQQRFGAGIIAGFNAAQVNGDDMGGYNKIGLRGGLRGTYSLSDQTELSMDLLYSIRGSASSFTPDNTGFPRNMGLHYIEVPVQFTYKEWLSSDGTYHRVRFSAGLAYGRLFDKNLDGFPVIEDEQDNFHDNDYSFTVGSTYMFSQSFGLGINWTRSINYLYNNDKHRNAANIPIYKVPLTGYFFSVQMLLLL